MATHGARRLSAMARNVEHIVGIELLAAAQGCDFHAPLLTSDRLERVRALIRREVPHLDEDRHLAPDILRATQLVVSGAIAEAAGADVLPAIAVGAA